jgi:hypothetical protein
MKGSDKQCANGFWLIITLLFVSVLLTVGSEKRAVVSGGVTVADLTNELRLTESRL